MVQQLAGRHHVQLVRRLTCPKSFAWQAGCAAWLLSTVEASLLKHMLCPLRSLPRRPVRIRSPSLACEALLMHCAADAQRGITCCCAGLDWRRCVRSCPGCHSSRTASASLQSALKSDPVSSAPLRSPNTHRSIIPLAPFGMADYDGGERFDLRVRKRGRTNTTHACGRPPQPFVCSGASVVPATAQLQRAALP